MRNEQDKSYWSSLWWAARTNVGHSSTRVRALLGYPLYDQNGRNYAAKHFYTDATRGTKPRSEARQRLLKALASPYGPVIAKAILIKRGLDPDFMEGKKHVRHVRHRAQK